MRNMTTNRFSNIELLRLVCMFFIVMLHILYEVISFHSLSSITINNIAYNILFSLVVCAVNVFVLISGYFGINFKIKGFVGYYLQCVYYSIVCLLMAWVLGLLPEQPTVNMLYDSIFVYSHSPGWWFPVVYAILYLVSPLLNIIVEHLNRRKFIILLIVLSFLNVYLGYFMQDQFNPIGYNAQQFIYMYCIGRYLHSCCEFNNKGKWRKYSLSVYILSCLIWCVIGFLNNQFIHSDIAFLDLFPRVAYNNPMVLVSSISLFVFFLTLEITSSSIRFWSSSAFAVYLITCNKYVAPAFYHAYGLLFQCVSTKYKVLLLVVVSLATLIICISIDKIRIILMTPMNLRMNSFLDKKESKLRTWMNFNS